MTAFQVCVNAETHSIVPGPDRPFQPDLPWLCVINLASLLNNCQMVAIYLLQQSLVVPRVGNIEIYPESSSCQILESKLCKFLILKRRILSHRGVKALANILQLKKKKKPEFRLGSRYPDSNSTLCGSKISREKGTIKFGKS